MQFVCSLQYDMIYDGYCKRSDVEVRALLFVPGGCGRNGCEAALRNCLPE